MNCHLCIHKKCHSEGLDCFNFGRSPHITPEYRNASSIEADYYNRYNRFQELVEYCRLNAYTRIGVAFCIGLSSEAEEFCNMLKAFSLDIVSVCCKIGGISKGDLGIKKITNEGFESICNPYFQAELCNSEKTQLNIIFGLCMGHDIEFTKSSEAPVTTFLVKDRVLGHNPVVCLYSRYIKNKIIADSGK